MANREIPEDVSPEEVEAQVDDTATGILAGGQLVRVMREGRDDIFLQVYGLGPGSGQWVFWQYQDQAQVEATFGDAIPSITNISETNFQARVSNDMWNAGEAAEIQGLAGNFNQFYSNVQVSALRAAGIHDPSIQGRLLADPDVQRIIAVGSIGQEITPAQIKAELRNTTVWREDLYPGIDFFYNRGDADPESAWRTYSNNVTNGLRELGFTPDSDGSFRTAIGGMLNDGISDAKFQKFLPVAKRVQQNPGLKAQLDEWSNLELGRPLDFNEFLDVLEGTNDPELDSIIEGATLAFAAERAGVQVPVAEIRRLAQETDLTEEQAVAAFTEQERTLLAIGEQDLATRGISRGDFLDVAAGARPRSGVSAAEIQRIGQQLIAERGASDDPQARFFLNFNQRGAPQRSGLQSLSGIGG